MRRWLWWTAPAAVAAAWLAGIAPGASAASATATLAQPVVVAQPLGNGMEAVGVASGGSVGPVSVSVSNNTTVTVDVGPGAVPAGSYIGVEGPQLDDPEAAYYSLVQGNWAPYPLLLASSSSTVGSSGTTLSFSVPNGTTSGTFYLVWSPHPVHPDYVVVTGYSTSPGSASGTANFSVSAEVVDGNTGAPIPDAPISVDIQVPNMNAYYQTVYTSSTGAPATLNVQDLPINTTFTYMNVYLEYQGMPPAEVFMCDDTADPGGPLCSYGENSGENFYGMMVGLLGYAVPSPFSGGQVYNWTQLTPDYEVPNGYPPIQVETCSPSGTSGTASFSTGYDENNYDAVGDTASPPAGGCTTQYFADWVQNSRLDYSVASGTVIPVSVAFGVAPPTSIRVLNSLNELGGMTVSSSMTVSPSTTYTIYGTLDETFTFNGITEQLPITMATVNLESTIGSPNYATDFASEGSYSFSWTSPSSGSGEIYTTYASQSSNVVNVTVS